MEFPLKGKLATMEKRKPHYRLSEIQAQMDTVQGLRLTESAKVGIRRTGMTNADAVQVVQGLSRRSFYNTISFKPLQEVL